MGSIVTTVACCNGSIGENNVDEEVEDKITVAEEMNNYDDPQIKMPALHRSWSQTTLPVR